MKLPTPGKTIWVSRFSPTALESTPTEKNNYTILTKNDIFTRPFRAVITTIQQYTQDKWYLVVEPSTMSVEQWSIKPCGKKGEVGSASLLGKTSLKTQQILLEVGVKNGKIVAVSNNYIISAKRIQNFKTNQQVLRKFLKIAKNNHKYNQMNMITSCLLDVHTASQSQKMIQQNPENFI